MPFFLFAAVAALVNVVIGGELRITSADAFIEFSNSVNDNVSYYGSTVFLDSDLDFSGKTLEPIGHRVSYYYSNYFNGTFDGQGYVIKNLNITSSSQYVGLFGYSKGLTIKNVILDSSCTITSLFSGFDLSYIGGTIGGIIGDCSGEKGPHLIENNVNMGSVTFSGNISDNLFPITIGGVVGEISTFYGYGSIVKNCANYGDITHSGDTRSSRIGGIVGDSCGSSSEILYIRNSFNYGKITHDGTTRYELYLGGIVGRSHHTAIENCVCGGKISTNNSTFTGSIVGYDWSGTLINYTYFTSKLSGFDKYGFIEYSTPSESNTFSYDDTTFELNGTVSVGNYTGNSLNDALNAHADYYTLRDYSHWLLNKGNKTVTLTINKRSTFTLNCQVILLPSLVSEGNKSFDGWYTDSGFTKPLTKYEITESKNLYANFEENTNNYTISFETRREGVSVAPITAPFGSVIILPSDSIREHCTVGYWENAHGDYIGLNLTVPSHNITLYAAWKCANIKDPDDLFDFSKVVNKGNNYYGTTVFLDSDIDLNGKAFEPIGYYYFNYFRGVFDGQGHVISNLIMNSSSQYVGLFGNSTGLTIKNAILDSSCSISSTFNGIGHAYMGGFIGYCYTLNGPCINDNSVNMGSVTFIGNISSSYNSLYLGGIAGYIISWNNNSLMKNCANYGDLTHSGNGNKSYLGGIAGYFEHGFLWKAYIYNCINYGRITQNATTSSELHIGGIAGYAQYVSIENCVNGGKLSSNNSTYTGGIAGEITLESYINYTYYTSDLNDYDKYGQNDSSLSESNTFSYDSTTFQLSGTVSIESYTENSLIDALNAYADYYPLRNYSHWLLNKERNNVSFVINERTNPIKMDYQIILLPSLASEGNL